MIESKQQKTVVTLVLAAVALMLVASVMMVVPTQSANACKKDLDAPQRVAV